MDEKSPNENSSGLDARGAAFAFRAETVEVLEWRGHAYEIRPATLEFQDAMAVSKASSTEKAISQIIHCTYWPPGSPGTEQGRPLAGQPMFNEKDRPTIRKSYGDPKSLWVAILKKIGEMSQSADPEKLVQEMKGNS